MDDDDSLLERIDAPEESVNDIEIDESVQDDKDGDDINGALDYSEDPEEDEEIERSCDGEASDNSEEPNAENTENVEKDGEEGELEDGELEDGEIEDSDEEKEKKEASEGEITDDDKIVVKNQNDGRRNNNHGRPIEVCSNDSRLSRPGGNRQVILPPIVHRHRPISAPKSVVENSWEKGLMEAKRLMEKASVIRQEDPDFEQKKLLAAPIGEREYGRRNEISSDEGNADDPTRQRNIPPLMEVRTRTFPQRGQRDLGPQVIYPTRDSPVKNNQRNVRANHVPERKPEFRERRISNRRSPPPPQKSASPVGRGISFSPTRDASPISSDSDEEIMKKRIAPPLKTAKKEERKSQSESSSSSSSSSRSTSRSEISSDDESDKRKSRSEVKRKNSSGDYKDPWARKARNSADIGRGRNISSSETPSPNRRRTISRSSSGTPSPHRMSNFNGRVRHMKRSRPNTVKTTVMSVAKTSDVKMSPIRQNHSRNRSRTRSPPPYPPGMKPRNDRTISPEYDRNSGGGGDITSYRIPKRGGASRNSDDSDVREKKRIKTAKKKKNNGETIPAFLSERKLTNKRKSGGIEAKSEKKRKLEEVIVEISESDEEKIRRNERSDKRGKRRNETSSDSDSSDSNDSSQSDSSRSSSPELPARYRPRSQNSEDRKSKSGYKSSGDEATGALDNEVKTEDHLVRISVSPSPPPPKQLQAEEVEEIDNLLDDIPAPPPPNESPVPPPPAPPMFEERKNEVLENENDEEEERKRELKREQLMRQLNQIDRKIKKTSVAQAAATST